MTKDQLQEALDRYGGDPERWPADLRDAAQRLSATDETARHLLTAAATVERGLSAAARPMAVDAALIGRIVAGIDRAAGHELALRPTRRLAAWAGAAMVAVLVTGFAAGLAIPQTQADDTSLASLMFGGSAYGDDATSGSLL
jgi:hypothetical protein